MLKSSIVLVYDTTPAFLTGKMTKTSFGIANF